MATIDKGHNLFENLTRLRAAVTEASIGLLRGERFAEAQSLTQIGQELKEVEQRLSSILRNGSSPAAPATSNPTERGTKSYPRYVRQGDLLIKIGQRRDRKGTYEQKVGKPEFEEIVSAIRGIAEKKKDFEAGEITQSVTCPSYQVYLVIGFLEEGGYLESPSRGLYRFTTTDGSRAAALAWDQARTKV